MLVPIQLSAGDAFGSINIPKEFSSLNWDLILVVSTRHSQGCHWYFTQQAKIIEGSKDNNRKLLSKIIKRDTFLWI